MKNLIIILLATFSLSACNFGGGEDSFDIRQKVKHENGTTSVFTDIVYDNSYIYENEASSEGTNFLQTKKSERKKAEKFIEAYKEQELSEETRNQ